MPRKKLTEEEVDAFRDRAMNAAEQLYQRDGINAVSMRQLAKELGCSTTTPYRYFQDHEALVVALRTRAFERFSRALFACVENVAPGRNAVHALCRCYISYATDNRVAYRLMFDTLPPKRSFPELQLAVEQAFGSLRNAVSDAMQQAAIAGDDNLHAHLIWVRLHGLVSLDTARKLNFGCDVQQLTDAMLSELFPANGRS